MARGELTPWLLAAYTSWSMGAGTMGGLRKHSLVGTTTKCQAQACCPFPVWLVNAGGELKCTWGLRDLMGRNRVGVDRSDCRRKGGRRREWECKGV